MNQSMNESMNDWYTPPPVYRNAIWYEVVNRQPNCQPIPCAWGPILPEMCICDKAQLDCGLTGAGPEGDNLSATDALPKAGGR
jgi:hypothetical protein